MIFNYKKKIVLISFFSFVFFFFLIFPNNVNAIRIFSTPASVDINSGGTFEVSWFINTENEKINAFQGKILYLPNIFKIKEIKTGNSIINFWIEPPKNNDQNGIVTFSGIIPGGYLGSNGKLFSLVFEVIKPGNFDLIFQEIQVFLNDGRGTALTIPSSSIKVVSDLNFKSSSTQIGSTHFDIFLPEISTPIVTRDKNFFKNKFVLLFSAQDKDSGIKYFEVCEGNRICEATESPYVLKNQKLTDEIIVKVYDNNGNQKSVTLPPQRSFYEKELSRDEFEIKVIFSFFIIGILMFIFRIFYKKKL